MKVERSELIFFDIFVCLCRFEFLQVISEGQKRILEQDERKPGVLPPNKKRVINIEGGISHLIEMTTGAFEADRICESKEKKVPRGEKTGAALYRVEILPDQMVVKAGKNNCGDEDREIRENQLLDPGEPSGEDKRNEAVRDQQWEVHENCLLNHNPSTSHEPSRH